MFLSYSILIWGCYNWIIGSKLYNMRKPVANEYNELVTGHQPMYNSFTNHLQLVYTVVIFSTEQLGCPSEFS